MSANLQTPTRAEAAEMLSVSERTVNAAAKVKDEGTPELVAAVESGHASCLRLRLYGLLLSSTLAGQGLGLVLNDSSAFP